MGLPSGRFTFSFNLFYYRWRCNWWICAGFLIGGALGAIGSKNRFKEFKRIGQIENSLTDLVSRSFKKNGFKEASKTLVKKSKKYTEIFLKPAVTESIQSLFAIPIKTGLYWVNKGLEFIL